MHDYIIRTNSLFEILVPYRSAYIEVKAIEEFKEENGEISPKYATGYWHIISIADGEEFPSELTRYVKASGNREKGLNLPDGVIALSNIWAGMKVRS